MLLQRLLSKNLSNITIQDIQKIKRMLEQGEKRKIETQQTGEFINYDLLQKQKYSLKNTHYYLQIAPQKSLLMLSGQNSYTLHQTQLEKNRYKFQKLNQKHFKTLDFMFKLTEDFKNQNQQFQNHFQKEIHKPELQENLCDKQLKLQIEKLQEKVFVSKSQADDKIISFNLQNIEEKNNQKPNDQNQYKPNLQEKKQPSQSFDISFVEITKKIRKKRSQNQTFLKNKNIHLTEGEIPIDNQKSKIKVQQQFGAELNQGSQIKPQLQINDNNTQNQQKHKIGRKKNIQTIKPKHKSSEKSKQNIKQKSKSKSKENSKQKQKSSEKSQQNIKQKSKSKSKENSKQKQKSSEKSKQIKKKKLKSKLSSSQKQIPKQRDIKILQSEKALQDISLQFIKIDQKIINQNKIEQQNQKSIEAQINILNQIKISPSKAQKFKIFSKQKKKQQKKQKDSKQQNDIKNHKKQKISKNKSSNHSQSNIQIQLSYPNCELQQDKLIKKIQIPHKKIENEHQKLEENRQQANCIPPEGKIEQHRQDPIIEASIKNIRKIISDNNPIQGSDPEKQFLEYVEKQAISIQQINKNEKIFNNQNQNKQILHNLVHEFYTQKPKTLIKSTFGKKQSSEEYKPQDDELKDLEDFQDINKRSESNNLTVLKKKKIQKKTLKRKIINKNDNKQKDILKQDKQKPIFTDEVNQVKQQSDSKINNQASQKKIKIKLTPEQRERIRIQKERLKEMRIKQKQEKNKLKELQKMQKQVSKGKKKDKSEQSENQLQKEKINSQNKNQFLSKENIAQHAVKNFRKKKIRANPKIKMTENSQGTIKVLNEEKQVSNPKKSLSSELNASNNFVGQQRVEKSIKIEKLSQSIDEPQKLYNQLLASEDILQDLEQMHNSQFRNQSLPKHQKPQQNSIDLQFVKIQPIESCANSSSNLGGQHIESYQGEKIPTSKRITPVEDIKSSIKLPKKKVKKNCQASQIYEVPQYGTDPQSQKKYYTISVFGHNSQNGSSLSAQSD